MIWLTGHLLGVLALTAVLAGFAGWCWHAWRHADAAQALETERARLRADLMRRARLGGGSALSAQAQDDADAQDERAFLRHSTQRQAERVAQLERELASIRAENEQAELLNLENADLRAALQARDVDFHAADDLRARIAELEDQLAHAPIGAAPAVAALAPVPDQFLAPEPSDAAALRWRALYFERRVIHQGAEHAAALAALQPAQPGPAPDSEQDQITQWRLRYFSARAAYLEKRLAEHETAASPAAETDGDAETEQARRQAWRLSYLDRRLESFADQAREAVGAAQTEAQALANRLAANDREASAIAARVTAAQEEAFTYLARAEAAEAALDGVQARVAEQDGEISALRRDLQAAQAELAAEPKEDGEKTRLRWKATYLETRVRQLEEKAYAAPLGEAAVPAPPREVVPDAPRFVAEPALPPAKPAAAATRPKRLPAPRGGAPDDLRLIPGVTPQIESKLNASGIFHFDQIAEWTGAEASWIDQYLAMRGQIARDGWIDQAGRLARGEAALQLSTS